LSARLVLHCSGQGIWILSFNLTFPLCYSEGTNPWCQNKGNFTNSICKIKNKEQVKIKLTCSPQIWQTVLALFRSFLMCIIFKLIFGKTTHNKLCFCTLVFFNVAAIFITWPMAWLLWGPFLQTQTIIFLHQFGKIFASCSIWLSASQAN
jgi:hypothetical protein